MAVPKVVIVGRPNVGKSSLLNWLARKTVSVVDPTAGVTRDRVTYLLQEKDRYFELVDTGGMGVVDADNLAEDIERQIQLGIDEADLLLFVVDGQAGVTPLDQGSRRPPPPRGNAEAAGRQQMRFHQNRCGAVRVPQTDRCPGRRHQRQRQPQPQGTSGRRSSNNCRPPRKAKPRDGELLGAEPELKLAIVGRRNAGKSTFINALAEEERVIVSEVAGTTRDSVDVRFEVDGKTLIAIDTPGVRKRKSLANDIEFYGLVRAKRSIRRADVVFMFFDARETISRVDKQLVDEISRALQALRVRGQQMGSGLRSRDDRREVDRVSVSHVRLDAARSDRVRHRQRQPEHPQGGEPRPVDFQAIPQAGGDVEVEQTRAGGGVGQSAASPQEPPAENSVRHASRHRTADDRAQVQRFHAVR